MQKEMPKELIKEKWTSNEGDREDHYFMGPDKKEYVFGYNPKFINPYKLELILKIIESPMAPISPENLRILNLFKECISDKEDEEIRKSKKSSCVCGDHIVVHFVWCPEGYTCKEYDALPWSKKIFKSNPRNWWK